MSHTLTTGLTDTARELGESSATINTGAVRIRAYNDAILHFVLQKKWPFLIKSNATISTAANVKTYSLSTITDMRHPGAIYEVYLGSETTPYIPIEWKNRNNDEYVGGRYCYLTPDNANLVFVGDITSVKVITIWYYYLPARIEDSGSVSLFPIPDSFRKAIATLAAAFIQYSRYLDSQGNRLFNMYEKMVGMIEYQQSERSVGNKMKIEHPLKRFGMRRIYPGGRK